MGGGLGTPVVAAVASMDLPSPTVRGRILSDIRVEELVPSGMKFLPGKDRQLEVSEAQWVRLTKSRWWL